jgi:CheY-like chemotaxis protein
MRRIVSLSVAKRVSMQNLAAGSMHLPTAVAAHFCNASPSPDTAFNNAFAVLPSRWDEDSVTDQRLLVSVVDDDESVRESLPDLLHELGFAAHTFSSAEEFLNSPMLVHTGCLLLDIAMPGMGGLGLSAELKRRGIGIPIIFITAHREESMRKRVLAQGALECLVKPFSDTALLNALHAALPK